MQFMQFMHLWSSCIPLIQPINLVCAGLALCPLFHLNTIVSYPRTPFWSFPFMQRHVESTRMSSPSLCRINAQLDQAVVPPGCYALRSWGQWLVVFMFLVMLFLLISFLSLFSFHFTWLLLYGTNIWTFVVINYPPCTYCPEVVFIPL